MNLARFLGPLCLCSLATSACRSLTEQPPGAVTLPVVTAAPAAVAKKLATPDDPFRYTAPPADTVPPWTPPVAVEAHLPNGLRTLLLESHDSPYVAAQITLLRDDPAAAPGLEEVFFEALLASPPDPGAPPLKRVVESLGATLSYECEADATFLRLWGARPAIGPAIGAVLRAIARPDFTKEDVEAGRAAAQTAVAAKKHDPGAGADRERLYRAIDAAFLPANHRYIAPETTAADLQRVTFNDIVHWRRAALGPARTAVSVSGDMTPAALQEVAQGAAGAWAAKTPPLAKRPQLPHGIFVVETPGATTTDVGVLFPLPGGLYDNAAVHLAGTVESKRVCGNQGAVKEVLRRGLSYVVVALMADESDPVENVVQRVLDTCSHATLDDISTEVARTRRPALAEDAEDLYSSVNYSAYALGWIAAAGHGPSIHRQYHTKLLGLRASDLAAETTAIFDRKEARVVTYGALPAVAKLAHLGLGKVAVKPAGNGSGARP